MEEMNVSELRAALIEKNLIDEAGTVNTFTVNCISGAHTLPLLSEVWGWDVNFFVDNLLSYLL